MTAESSGGNNKDNRSLMMSNLGIWDKVARPPKEALKTIVGGRLRGMTDINPQWRYKAITEVYGPAGTGWYYEIDHMWTENGVGEVKMAFVTIKLYTNNGGTWSQPIVGIGGSELVEKEKAGFYSNDEAYKMATTDALSVAMKMLGIGADIYAGLWDGSKYKEQEPENKPVDEAKLKELQAHAKRGTSALKEAWTALSASARESLKGELAALKVLAKEWDEQLGIQS